MNIASSNINQWTLLVAVLPVVFSWSRHSVSAIPLNSEQQAELLLTIAQSVVALVFLLNMSFAWWEALFMFTLFAAQLVLPPFLGESVKVWIAAAFLGWAAMSTITMVSRWKQPAAIREFLQIWRAHVSR